MLFFRIVVCVVEIAGVEFEGMEVRWDVGTDILVSTPCDTSSACETRNISSNK